MRVYKIKKYTHGLHIDSIAAEPETRTLLSFEAPERLPGPPVGDIPELPAIDTMGKYC
jgi:hypothetical protein